MWSKVVHKYIVLKGRIGAGGKTAGPCLSNPSFPPSLYPKGLHFKPADGAFRCLLKPVHRFLLAYFQNYRKAPFNISLYIT